MNKGSDGEVVVRERVKPRNPKSAPQQNVRGAFKTSSGSFKAMAGADADAWDTYGQTQRSKAGKPLSGIGAYNRLAIVYRLVNPGGTPPTVPPTADYFGPDVQVTATAQPNAVVFTGTDVVEGANRIEILLQRLPAGNAKPTLGAYKTVTYTMLHMASGFAYTASVTPGRYAAAYRFVNRLTGQQTELVQLSVLGVTLEVVQGGADEKPAAGRKKAA